MTRIRGFIDLQINGYHGIDFSASDLTEEAICKAFEAIVASGTVGFLPTVITSSPDVYAQNLPMLARVMDSTSIGKHALGIHLEGPFLCPEAGYIGAHNPKHTRLPDPHYVHYLQNLAEGKICAMTMAAGLTGGAELITMANALGIRIFLGHQNCNTDELKRMAEAGAVALTHLGNGLPNDLNRFANPLWAGLVTNTLIATMITDGHHVCDDLIRIIFQMKGRENVILVSDASPIAGLPPGRYFTLGNEVVLEPSGYLYAVGKQCLAGSSANMLHCANYLAKLEILMPEEIVDIAFYHPLKLIGRTPNDIPNGVLNVYFEQKTGQFVCKEFPEG